MSTYSFVAKLRRGISVGIALPLLSGVLIALQLVLPSGAFASSTQSNYSFGTFQPMDQASVSVVRLVVSYGVTAPIPGCQSSSVTGLGVLVGSWAASAGSTTINNWVLTDGSLVNPNGLTCSERPFQGAFTEIAIKHAVVPPPSLREKVSALSPAVEEVVLRALAKDPKERFGSVLAFAEALERAR